MGEIVDGERNPAGEVVEGEVESAQPSQLSQTLRKLAGEEVVLEVEAAEELEVGEVGGDGPGETVGAEAEDSELGQEAECAGGDLTHEAGAGEADGVDGGAVGVALDAEPVAGRDGRVPLQAILMWCLGEESKERLLVLSRLRVDSAQVKEREKKEDKKCERRRR